MRSLRASQLEAVQRTVAMLLLAGGLLVCLSWAFGLQELTRISSASTFVQFVTGVCFALLGASLWAMRQGHRRTVAAIAALVLAIGVWTVLEYASGRTLLLDTLWPSAVAQPAAPFPGRMAINTALTMMLAATAILLSAVAPRFDWTPAVVALLATVVTAIGCAALLGYAVDLTAVAEWAGLSRMAVLTALLVVMLGIALLILAFQVARAQALVETPWLPISVGTGFMLVGLLVWSAIQSQGVRSSTGIGEMILALSVLVSALLTGSLAQARSLRRQRSELLRANDRLDRIAAELGDLYENAPCGYHSLDSQGRIVRVNATALSWLQRSRDEVVGRPFADQVSPASAALVADSLEKLAREGIVSNVELELCAADGSRRPVLLSATSQASPRAESRCTLHDISDRRRAEEADRLLTAVVAQSDDAIVTETLDGRVTSWNAGAERLFGYTAAEMMGQSLDRLLAPDQLEEKQRLLAMIGSGQKVPSFESTRIRKDGSIVELSVTLSPIVAAGKVVGASKIARDISARKQMERALRDSEHRAQSLLQAAQSANERLQQALDRQHVFMALIENSSDFIGIADPAGVPMYVNPAGRRMVGLKPDTDVRETQIQDYYADDQKAFARDVIYEQMINRGHWRGETAFRHWSTGARIPVSDEHFLIRDPDSQRLLGMGTVTRDISEIKQAEAAAQRANEELAGSLRKLQVTGQRLAMALRAGAIGVWEWDLANNTVTWDEQMYALYGITPGSAVSYTTWREAVLPADRADAEATVQRTASARLPTENRFRIRRPDGGIRHIEAAEEPVVDEAGNVVSVIGVNRDVTAARLLEESLRSSEERMRLSFDHSAVGFGLVSLDGRWMTVNPALCGMLGQSAVELAGRSVHGSSHPEDLQADRSQLGKVAEGDSSAVELRLVHKDGHGVWVRRSAALVRDATNAPLHIVVHVEDISSARQAQAAAAQAVRELEAFSYSVAHDLRAPLRAVIGFAQLLRRISSIRDDARASELLAEISGAAERMGQLIDDLLALSRVDRSELALKPVDLSALAHDVSRRLRQTDPGRDVEFSIAAGMVARADERLVRTALENLIGNAWKYTGKQAHARIEVGACAEGALTWYFVRDNGVGFDMAHAGKLFGAFQRLHGENEFEGTGIGLAIVQRIVRRHGGTIRAEGAVGAGATFKFTLG